MYYGSMGALAETERDYLAEIKTVMPCYSWEHDKCRKPSNWADEGPDAAVPPYQHCELLRAAEDQQPEKFMDWLDNEVPYCTYQPAPTKTPPNYLLLGGVAVVGLVVGALMF